MVTEQGTTAFGLLHEFHLPPGPLLHTIIYVGLTMNILLIVGLFA